MRGGKTRANAQKDYADVLRAPHAAWCPHNALGQQLVCLFTLRRTPWPDWRDPLAWIQQPLFPASDPQSNMGYDAMQSRLLAAAAAAHIERAVTTHGFRKAQVQNMFAEGIGYDVRHLLFCFCRPVFL